MGETRHRAVRVCLERIAGHISRTSEAKVIEYVEPAVRIISRPCPRPGRDELSW